MKSIQTGEAAPDFTAESAAGQQFSLSSYRGKQSVVLYFYPRDGTSVCTAQACAFRDAYEDFTQAGAVVIGVSEDSLAKHRDFSASKQLPFILLSDADGRLQKLYGVSKTLGLIPRRITFVIDKQGIVRHTFSALLSGDKHVVEALAIVRQLAESNAPS